MRMHSLAILLAAGLLEARASAQRPAGTPSTTASLSRPCSALPAASRKGKAKARSGASGAQPGSACLEAKASLVDLHEFFQSYVREQRWNIDDEKIAADSWIFSRYLDKDELLQFAKEGSYAGRVQWTEGKAIVQISAHELDGRFTRVEVIARLQGSGQNVDRFAPPRDTWDLESTGTLEKSLIAALEAHLQSLH